MGNLKVLTVLIAALGFNLLEATELCLTGDFDSQFHYVLQNEMLSDKEVRNISQVFHQLQIMLGNQWPGTVVTPFGSLVIGLGLKSSDADCIVKVPKYKQNEQYLAIETTKLLLEKPDVYQELNSRVTRSVPVITFYHTPTERYCDLSFRGTPTAVESSKLIYYYMYLHENIRKVTVFLKFWSRIHGVIGSSMLPSYGLTVMAIFYFQQKRMAPPVKLLQQSAKPYYINDWNVAFEWLPLNNNETESVYDLLRGFYEYYSEFNFDDYVVSVYAGRPVLKSAFNDVDTVPEEFNLYKRCVKAATCELADFRLNLFIQDTFEHNRNILLYPKGKRRDPMLESKFRSYVKHAAEMFKKLPRDEVLRAILVRQGERRPLKKKRIVIDDVSDRIDCN